MNDADGSAFTRRGDARRAALIRAAIDIFGRRGYDGASTRTIAAAAGVNQALIGYHFGGKAGLYLAVFEHIAAIMEQRIGPTLAQIEQELGPDASAGHGADTSKRALAGLQRLIDALIAMMTSEESAAWANLILREQQAPSEGFDLLYRRFMSRVLSVIARLLGRARDVDPASAEARLTTLTIVGQVLLFRTARAAVMRQLDWQRIGSGEVDLIRRTIHRNLAAILTREDSE